MTLIDGRPFVIGFFSAAPEPGSFGTKVDFENRCARLGPHCIKIRFLRSRALREKPCLPRNAMNLISGYGASAASGWRAAKFSARRFPVFLFLVKAVFLRPNPEQVFL